MASAFLVLPPNRVVRADGTLVKLEAASAPHVEVIAMWNLLRDWRMLGEPLYFLSSPHFLQ